MSQFNSLPSKFINIVFQKTNFVSFLAYMVIQLLYVKPSNNGSNYICTCYKGGRLIGTLHYWCFKSYLHFWLYRQFQHLMYSLKHLSLFLIKDKRAQLGYEIFTSRCVDPIPNSFNGKCPPFSVTFELVEVISTTISCAPFS